MKNARMRTTRTAHTTRATRSQCPVKRVPASLRTLVSVLAAVCVDADPRFIAVLLVWSSRADHDQLAFDFHYTCHFRYVYILPFWCPHRERVALRPRFAVLMPQGQAAGVSGRSCAAVAR